MGIFSVIEYVPAGVLVLVETVSVENPWLVGVIEMEVKDHDAFAPEMLMLACGRLTVSENPLTLVAVNENVAELPAVMLCPEPLMLTL